MAVDEEQTPPETYLVKRTAYCPNSDLPVLVYRGVLGGLDEDGVSERLQSNGWVKKGTWGTIKLQHFHPNTHECYGIFQGRSELVFGEGSSDAPGTGVRCQVRAGDVVVVPAGVSHASVPEDESAAGEEDEYRYVGVYPEGSPDWRYELGKKSFEEKGGLVEEVAGVGVPRHDPVYGLGGPLVTIWKTSRGVSAV
ncbi:cupin domain-containing protein [Colletotrichum karsti]|uniref:Cupin domain-containing protein n=1 Tax=Colletotrichum karsti TaxID=1095194 RepID=A0A9P6I6D6_9PEZI|nr:cupin domain-containing protein [Colletotrichum karsti]KAF9872830.1 cupin domain-containing protein [Colletotrichum karsti]